MSKIWPEGTEKALQVSMICLFLLLPELNDRLQVLDKFLHGQARQEHLGLVDPLQQFQADGPEEETSRIKDYASSRNSCDGNSSSRMSPYLASGIVSARMCLNKAKALTNGKLESGRDSGIGMWVQEVSSLKSSPEPPYTDLPTYSAGRVEVSRVSSRIQDLRSCIAY